MRIIVRFFASQREAAGVERQEIELPDGARAADALEAAARRYPGLRAAASATALAVNRDLAPPDTKLHDGDEVALLPPVAGG